MNSAWKNSTVLWNMRLVLKLASRDSYSPRSLLDRDLSSKTRQVGSTAIATGVDCGGGLKNKNSSSRRCTRKSGKGSEVSLGVAIAGGERFLNQSCAIVRFWKNGRGLGGSGHCFPPSSQGYGKTLCKALDECERSVHPEADQRLGYCQSSTHGGNALAGAGTAASEPAFKDTSGDGRFRSPLYWSFPCPTPQPSSS